MRYKIKKGIIIEKTKNKITIFDPERSTLLTLNESASFIFEKIKSGIGEDKIIEFINKKYKVNKKILDKDYSILINKLRQKKIIE